MECVVSGAELYDAETPTMNPPICQELPAPGAHGYLGSTTIAWGQSDTNDRADLICQYFLINLPCGCVDRTRRAASATAVRGAGGPNGPDQPEDPGPVLPAGRSECPPGRRAVGRLFTQGGAPAHDEERFSRAERRERLAQTGAFLRHPNLPPLGANRPQRYLPASRQALSNIAVQAGLKVTQPFAAFGIKHPVAAKPGKAILFGAEPLPGRHRQAGCGIRAPMRCGNRVAVVAKELDGRIVGSRIYHQR